jgi:hypothetical protein
MDPQPDQYLLQNQQKEYNGKLNWAFQIGKSVQVAGKRPLWLMQ